MRSGCAGCRGGFTLIEMLTVIGIIMVLVGLITAAIVSAQESGRLANCKNNLAQIHRLVLQYGATYGGYMPTWWHERWVGELGLVGKGWGNLPDDLNPNLAGVWGNFSYLRQWVQDPSYAADETGRSYLQRTASPILLCKSDPTQYRSDQGCVVSYVGLARYGWWCAGNGGSVQFCKKKGVADGATSDAGWNGEWELQSGTTGTVRSGEASTYEYHQISEYGNTSRRILLAETDPATWQYAAGTCG